MSPHSLYLRLALAFGLIYAALPTGGAAQSPPPRVVSADSVVIAWGGHIASSVDWHDDPGETVQTASDISGSPYHTRVISIKEGNVVKSIGNQDRSLSANAVSEPVATDVNVLADEDNTANGIGNTTSPSDDAQSGLTGTISVVNVSSINFASLNGTSVLDTGGNAVTSGGTALKYFWDAASNTLYASTSIASLVQAQDSVVFKIALTGFNYAFTLVKQVDHPSQDGTANDNTENNILIDLTYTAVGSGTTTGKVHVSIDDDMPTIGTPTPQGQATT